LVDDTRSQDELFHAAFAILRNAIAKRAFPSASVAVTLQNRLVALKAFGTHTYEGDSPAVSPATIFDVASLTKVVASTTIAMLLYQRGLLDLEAPVDAIVPEFIADSAKDGPPMQNCFSKTKIASRCSMPLLPRPSQPSRDHARSTAT
jgi:CubicO group peptidase (beta-lactamase class C family)